MKKSTRQLLIVAAVVAALVAVYMYSQRTPRKEEREGFTVDISMNAIKIFGIVMGVLAAFVIIMYFFINFMENRQREAGWAKYNAGRVNAGRATAPV